MNFSILFLATSQLLGLPSGLLDSVCYVESRHRVEAVNLRDGPSDSLGICQIKYDTAKLMGYRGTREDLHTNVKVNILWAGVYLEYQMKRYDRDIKKAVSAYNMGSYKELNYKTANSKYVSKVFKTWGRYNEPITK